MKIVSNYMERCYAGWLGKIVGVRLGAPVEGWEYAKIRSKLGDDVYNYIVDYNEFAADDDTNGPMFFLQALEDYECSENLTAEQIGKTWLNYTPYEHGFYWWGGYGIPTEHTAYLNLRAGIPAPLSGSIKQNGRTVAEQIGGQIFIDTWGLVNPGNPERAARFASKAASVSHDGEGIYGGMFVAACIAEAFTNHDIRSVVEKGLSLLPSGCEYVRMATDIFIFHDTQPDPSHWRDCYDFIYNNYGYDKYPGSCHIIPNSAVMILSMLYGEGDFTKSIGICNMCGWDTDCTTGNVGAILGVLVGLNGIDYERWLRPIHDFLACSNVMGCLNIMDVPNNVFTMARFAYRLNGEPYPEKWRSILEGKAARFNFQLPGSTHVFRVRCADDFQLENIPLEDGTRCLKCTVGLNRNDNEAEIYHQTYYHPQDFTDSRYDPFFSPILYPGQTITARLRLSPESSSRCTARMFVWDSNNGRRLAGDNVLLYPGEWVDLQLNIPPIKGGLIERAGVLIKHIEGLSDSLTIHISDVDFIGRPSYSLEFSNEKMERWTFTHSEITQMSRLKGLWYLEDGMLHGSCADYGEAYTGDVSWKDYTVTATLKPIVGDTHQFMARVQGACRCYGVRLCNSGKLQLVKNIDTRYQILEEIDFPFSYGQEYTFSLRCAGNSLTVLDKIDSTLIKYYDEDHPYLTGAIGVGLQQGHCTFIRLVVRS